MTAVEKKASRMLAEWQEAGKNPETEIAKLEEQGKLRKQYLERLASVLGDGKGSGERVFKKGEIDGFLKSHLTKTPQETDVLLLRLQGTDTRFQKYGKTTFSPVLTRSEIAKKSGKGWVLSTK